MGTTIDLSTTIAYDGTLKIPVGNGSGDPVNILANTIPSGATTLAALTDVLVDIPHDNMFMIGVPPSSFVSNSIENTAVGIGALAHITTGQFNAAFGDVSLANMTTAVNCTAVGSGAGYNLVAGSDCTIIGASAGGSIVNGQFNIALGENAGPNTDRSNTICIGFGAVSLSDNQIQIGNASGTIHTDAFFGDGSTILHADGSALTNLPPASVTEIAINTALQDGSSNLVLGTATGNTGTVSGGSNISFGVNAGDSLTSGNTNVSIGVNSGTTISSGAGNVSLGYSSGGVVTSGNNNTLLGTNTNTSSVSALNQIVIGYAAVGAGDNTAQIGDTAITNVYFGNGSAILHGNGSALTGLSGDPNSGTIKLSGMTANTTFTLPANAMITYMTIIITAGTSGSGGVIVFNTSNPYGAGTEIINGSFSAMATGSGEYFFAGGGGVIGVSNSPLATTIDMSDGVTPNNGWNGCTANAIIHWDIMV